MLLYLFICLQGKGKPIKRQGSRSTGYKAMPEDVRTITTVTEEQDRNRLIYGRHGYEARAESAASYGRSILSGSPSQKTKEGAINKSLYISLQNQN